MKKYSLQRRLFILIFTLTLGIWSGAAVLSWIENKEQMDEFFDTYQLHLARQLTTVDWEKISWETQQKTDSLIKKMQQEGEEDDDALGFAVFDLQGNLVFHDNEKGQYFSFQPVNGFTHQQLGKKAKKWRLLWLPSIDGKYWIAIGQEVKFRNEAALELLEESLFPWLLGLCLLWLLSGAGIYLTLRPFNRLATELKKRSADNLNPIDFKSIPLEAKPLLDALNGLFEKIKSVLAREHRFISDSAHELRTPLTALKVQLEVAELSLDDPATLEKAFQNLKKGIDRTSRLTEQLLNLSRLEAGVTSEQEKNMIDWKQFLNEILDDLKTVFPDIQTQVIVQEITPLKTKGNPVLYTHLIRNLLDNALKYRIPNTPISIILKKNEFQIENTCLLLKTEDIKRLGERFFRPAGQSQTGSGLGLALVQRIAKTQNLSCQIEVEQNLFRVTLKPILHTEE